MKYKTIIQICFCLLLTSLLLFASNSAPVSTTGAPGEMTCAKSDCHSDKALNSGVGLLTLSFENNVTEYIPGKTYKVKINIHESNIIRFGFQVLALNEKNNKNSGVIKITESERTQILLGYDSLADRQYLTYKYKGTDAVSNSNGEWTFEWTAPSIDEGPVTFYLAGITANNDGTDQGDNCYTKSFKINPNTLGVEDNIINNDIKIQINNNSQINLNYKLNINSDIKIDLYNINGIKINEWNYINEIAGNQNKYLLLNSNLNNGTYILNIYSNNKNQSQKFNINN
ncbi:MAG: hypothetical protein NTW25_13825 [Candidatus Kapabacteria bacterium]|nr:hypothetical protein [Candidatus Kapabacteria bacterium]